MDNFADITTKFLANNAALQVADESELESIIDSLLRDESRSRELGQAARKVVQTNMGSVERTVEMIISGIKTTKMVQTY